MGASQCNTTHMSDTTDWINAVGGATSALTASIALIVAAQAYKWNRRQRPRPIVIAEYAQSLGDLVLPMPIRLINVGTAAAFDATVAPLQVPGMKSPVLKT